MTAPPDPIETPPGMRPILTLHFPLPVGTVTKIMSLVMREYGKTAPKFIGNGGPTAVIFVPEPTVEGTP